MLMRKKAPCGFFHCHPFCSLLLGSLLGAGMTVFYFMYRDKINQMAGAVKKCACGCGEAAMDMVEDIKDGMGEG